MSTFKFNFSGTDVSNVDKVGNKEPAIQWLECEEIIYHQDQMKDLDETVFHARMFTCGDVEIGHIVAKDALLNMNCDTNLKNMVELAEKEHSDLVTGKYEGGLKIWECTSDLIEYLEEVKSAMNWKNTNVLDLGCGAGILGIYAFMNEANVTFQDYNKEVLECVTIPNVLLNIEEEREKEMLKCKFYSGDWASLNQKLPEFQQYDIILTSETIYNHENYEKLIDLFTQRLTEKGCAYVAAKTYYFGVGGGTRQFEESILKSNLSSAVCWKSSVGISREILKITRKS